MRVVKNISYICSIEGTYVLSEMQEKIVSQLSKMCTKKDGFYEDIKDVYICSARASSKGSLICKTVCLIEFFIPKEGEILNAIVEKYIDGKGLFCKFNKLNILVPNRDLSNKSFKEKEIVCVKLEKIRYQLGQYKGIGSLYQIN